jgi:hypothetical protein
VKTLVVGTVEPGAPTEAVHTTPVAYCSRLSSADTFIETATRILHRCGTERAKTVVAVMDGAGWLQHLIDGHRPDAVRILDFPHAAGYLCQAAQAAYGVGSQETSTWLDTWLHELKHGHPDVVLAALRQLPSPTPEAAASRATVLRYLTAHRDQIEYASFHASGYPIGSGMVESANKLLGGGTAEGEWDVHSLTVGGAPECEPDGRLTGAHLYGGVEASVAAHLAAPPRPGHSASASATAGPMHRRRPFIPSASLRAGCTRGAHLPSGDGRQWASYLRPSMGERLRPAPSGSRPCKTIRDTPAGFEY